MMMLVPVGLYLLALLIRLLAAEHIPFPTTEASAYYVGVAQNLVAGDGLVSDGLWSYATPPLEVPKPAFELWLPMSTFVSAAAMAVFGSSFWSAQLGSALLGALVAPLAWGIGREAARTQGLDARRGAAVAITSGLLGATLSPLVLGSVVPDSYVPFTVFMLAGASLTPPVLGLRSGVSDPDSRGIAAALGLGVAMGLAYLSRQEVIWLGLMLLLLLWWVLRTRPAGTRLREGAARLWPVLVGGSVVVAPWLLRNVVELGRPLPGQAIDNMFLIDNEDIFAFRDLPTAAAYLSQGLATVLGNLLVAAWDGFVNVVALPAFPVGLIGLAALFGMRRSPALRRPNAVVVLLISGALIFVSTTLLFPVATLWGTFAHSSGPLLVALIVVAALGGDALLARISSWRDWEKPNVILAPIALVSLAGLFAVFQLQVVAVQSSETEARYAEISSSIETLAAREGMAVPATVITDHPIWLAEALDSYAIALPDEELGSILELSRLFEAPWLIVVDERGRYPQALLDEAARRCLKTDPLALTTDAEPAWLFQLDSDCEVT